MFPACRRSMGLDPCHFRTFSHFRTLVQGLFPTRVDAQCRGKLLTGSSASPDCHVTERLLSIQVEIEY